MITLGLVANVDSNGVYVSMPGSRGVLRGPYKALSTVAAGTTVLVASTDDGEQVVVGPYGGSAPFDVASFGAVGDGTTDDSAAIQSAIDAAEDAGGGVVQFGRATYRCNVVLKPKVTLEGNGVGATVLKPAVGSNDTVVTGLDFDDLTDKSYASGDILLGARQSGIRHLTIDGDKANQSAGWGVRVWGCSLKLYDIQVQNCNDGGIWTEFTTHDAGTADDLLESMFSNIKIVGCGGDGWRWRGPHDSYLFNVVLVSNDGWGLRGDTTPAAVTCYAVNSWLNTTGSFSFTDGAKMYGCVASGDGGTGVVFGESTGGNVFHGAVGSHDTGIVACGDGVNVDVEASNISGAVLQIGVTAGATAGRVVATLSGSAVGTAVDVQNEATPSMIRGRLFCTTLVSGSFSDGTTVDLEDIGGSRLLKFPGAGFTAVGYSPQFPQSSGVLLTKDASSTTVGAAGAASALPATPTAYWTVKDETGASFKIPVYAT